MKICICPRLGNTRRRHEWNGDRNDKKAASDRHTGICCFKVKDPVHARNYKPGSLWEPAYVMKVMGS